MADLQTRPTIQIAAGLSMDERITYAFDLLRNAPSLRTKDEVLHRLQQIKDLFQGVQLSRRERQGLDSAMLVFALHEPGYSPAASKMLNEIIAEMTPLPRLDGPLHDEQGRIIDRTPPLPPLTDAEMQQLASDEASEE